MVSFLLSSAVRSVQTMLPSLVIIGGLSQPIEAQSRTKNGQRDAIPSSSPTQSSNPLDPSTSQTQSDADLYPAHNMRGHNHVDHFDQVGDANDKYQPPRHDAGRRHLLRRPELAQGDGRYRLHGLHADRRVPLVSREDVRNARPEERRRQKDRALPRQRNEEGDERPQIAQRPADFRSRQLGPYCPGTSAKLLDWITLRFCSR